MNTFDPLRNPARARTDGVRSSEQLVVEVGSRTLRVDSLSERSLTASLVRMSQPDRGVCVFGPVGRRPEQFAQAVERISQVTMLDVGSLEDGELPAACSVIAVSNGDREYSENAVAACKRHVERGGRLLALLGTPFALGGPPAPEQKSLDRLLAGWGILPGRDLILDTGSMNSVLNFGPSVVLITKVGPHAVFDGLENVALAFPLSRSLQVTKGAESVLATGPDTVAVNEVKGSEVTIGPGNSKPGPFTVAAAVTVEGTEHRGRVLVVGSSDWFGPQLRSMGNQTLLVNIVEWLSLDQEVPDIPPKRIENRPLQLTAYQTKCLNWVSLWVLPLACAVAGTGVWWRTRPRP